MYDKEKEEKRADAVLLLAQSFETKVDEQHSNYQVACTATGHMQSDHGANIFCILSSLPLQQARQCLAPTCYRRCGLAYPYDWIGFVRAKKKTSVGHLVC
jgi:hypothetical protein